MKNYKWKLCPADVIVHGFAEKDLTSDQFAGLICLSIQNLIKYNKCRRIKGGSHEKIFILWAH